MVLNMILKTIMLILKNNKTCYVYLIERGSIGSIIMTNKIHKLAFNQWWRCTSMNAVIRSVVRTAITMDRAKKF